MPSSERHREAQHHQPAVTQFNHTTENNTMAKLPKCICWIPFYDEYLDDTFTVAFTVSQGDLFWLLEALEDERNLLKMLRAVGRRAYNIDRLDLDCAVESSSQPLTGLGFRPGIPAIFPLQELEAAPTDIPDADAILMSAEQRAEAADDSLGGAPTDGRPRTAPLVSQEVLADELNPSSDGPTHRTLYLVGTGYRTNSPYPCPTGIKSDSRTMAQGLEAPRRPRNSAHDVERLEGRFRDRPGTIRERGRGPELTSTCPAPPARPTRPLTIGHCSQTRHTTGSEENKA